MPNFLISLLRKLLPAIFLLCLPFSSIAQTFVESVVWPEKIDAAEQIKEHFVYGLAQADNGDVLAFAEGRVEYGDDSPHHIVLKRSKNNGKDWLPSQILVRSSAEESFANPTPVIDKKTGTIFLFYAHNFHNESSKVYYLTSGDHGSTWSSPTEITHLFDDDPLKRPFHLPGPGHGITLNDGRILLQIWHRHSVKKPIPERQYGVSIIYSDDHGKTWKAGGYVPGVDDFTANESRLAVLGNKILLDARLADAGALLPRMQSFSSDGGLTWSVPQAGTIEKFSSVDAGLISVKREGRDYVLCTRPLGPGRKYLAVSYSTDGTKSWSKPKLLFKGPSNYSDIIELNDGSFLVLYGRGKPRYAAAVRFDWKWLAEEKQ